MLRPDKPKNVLLRARSGAKRRASTLIELLVVVALISFLLSLLLPSLKRSTDMAAATICRHHLRELGRSLEMYRMENGGWLPTVATASANSSNAVSALKREQPKPWFGKLYPTYLPDPMLLRCPKDPFGYRMATAFSPTSDQDVGDFASYGLNNFIMTAGGGRLANIERHAPRRPAATILSADLGPDDVIVLSSSPSRMTAPGPLRNDSLLMWGDGFDPFSPVRPNPWLTTRHADGIHMLTLTGGVYDVRTTELLRSPVQMRYPRCAAGGCTLCAELKLYHYSFAKDQLFWWTGPVPSD